MKPTAQDPCHYKAMVCPVFQLIGHAPGYWTFLSSTSRLAMPAPRMNRNRLAFLVSLVALSAATVVWGDLFRWSKVVYLPEWAKALPAPIMLPSYLAFVCLLPAAFVADSFASARAAVLKCVLLAPLASVTAYALNPLYHDRFLFANALFNYVWVVLFFCALPALLVVLIRAAIDDACKSKHG